MKKEILRIESITIKEKGIKTLNDFFLNLYEGELLGVFVHSAIEKRHLIELIYGNVEVEQGRICFENRPISYEDYVGIRKNKISMIQSTGKLIDDLTVADNIFVIRDRFGKYLIDKQTVHEQARRLMAELELSISPHKLGYMLTGYEKTAVEIAKAYALGARIIILKDLSSYLSDGELGQLTGLIGRLKGQGLSFVMIDSFTEVLKQFSDRLFVMKNGRNVWTLKSQQINDEILKTYFYAPSDRIKATASQVGSTALRFEGVATEGLDPLSFEIRSGEILSIVDHDGSGIEEIVKLLNGEKRGYKGDIYVGDRLFRPQSPWQALHRDLALIVENPIEAMLFKDISAIDNLCFSSSRKVRTFWMNAKYRRSCLDSYEEFFEKDVLKNSTDTLSAYDLQKLVYLKWHLYNPKVVICVRPFSSTDAELRQITSEMMSLLLEKGIGILVLASNYSEINSAGSKILLRPKECPSLSQE